MKRFYGIILLCTALTAFKTQLQAQPYPCAGITVEVTGVDPQNTSNYFGVKVTLDKPYSQNVTVNGNVAPDANARPISFSLTVTAGNLSVQSSNSLFSSSPTGEAILNILTISPSTVTSGSVTFSTQGFVGGCIENIERYKIFLNANSPNNNKPSKLILGTYSSDYNYDVNSTTLENLYDTVNDERHIVYVTPVSSQGEIIGNLFGIVVGENQDRILNAEFIVSERSQTLTKVDVTLLKSEQLGYYNIQNDSVKTFATTEGNAPNGIATFARSWWGCTRECISDVHIACHMDSHCSTMLWLTNVLSGFARPRGIGSGSGSIGISCGIYCGKNRNADLLPQY